MDETGGTQKEKPSGFRSDAGKGGKEAGHGRKEKRREGKWETTSSDVDEATTG